MVVLNDVNFLSYALKHYDRASVASLKEFEEDLLRFKYLNRLLNKYNIEDSSERLILNHIIVIYNCFGDGTLNMLLFRVSKENWDTLFSFLVFLDRVPDYIPEYGLQTTNLTINNNILDKLRKL